MAGIITKNTLDLVAKYVITVIGKNDQDWLEFFLMNRDGGCAGLFLRYAMTETYWADYDSADGAPDMETFENYKNKLTRGEGTNGEIIAALEYLRINVLLKGTVNGLSVYGAAMLGAIVCSSKGIGGQQFTENDKETIDLCIRTIETNNSLSNDLSDILIGLLKQNKNQLMLMMFIILYVTDYENFRKIVGQYLMQL